MAAPVAVAMAPAPAPAVAGDLLQGLQVYPSLVVKQRARGACIEYCFGCEVENEYKVFNPSSGGGQILTIREESECLQRTCCGNLRAVELSVTTIEGMEVVRYDRPWAGRQGGYFCCCLEACFQRMWAYSGAQTANPGAELGYVREDYSFCVPVLSVYNNNDDLQYTIIGNCCGCSGYTLKIYHPGDTDNSLGKIRKKWSGLGKELFTDADTFAVEFPGDATAENKALLIGATMLIDYLFFENNNNN